VVVTEIFGRLEGVPDSHGICADLCLWEDNANLHRQGLLVSWDPEVLRIRRSSSLERPVPGVPSLSLRIDRIVHQQRYRGARRSDWLGETSYRWTGA